MQLAASGTGTARRILVLDAGAETARALVSGLRELEYELVFQAAATPLSATTWAGSEPPALILLELGGDVPRALSQLHALRADANTAHVPVLLLTDARRSVDISRALIAGAHDFVPLPFSEDELRTRVTARLLTQRSDHPGSSSFPPSARGARRSTPENLAELKRYADVFESAADGIAALDDKACLLYANPGAYELLGYGPQDLPMGFAVTELVDIRDRRKLVGLQQRFAQRDFPRNVELRIRRKDQRIVIINCSFSPLHGPGGSEDGRVLFSFRDVTEAKTTQEQLVHTRNFLQSLIDASVDAIVAADMTGKIILFNEGAQRLYGHRQQDAIGKMNVRQLYPGDGAREVGRMLRAKGHGGVGRLEPVRMEAIDRTGSIFPISLTAATIYQNRNAVATFGIFTDLRDRVRVEEQLAQAQEKLAISEKQSLVAELAGATAHELNQPLTSVMGYAELLMRKVGEQGPGHRAAQVIHQEAERMAEIVRKIGKLTRYETKSYVGEQRILDLDRGSEDEGPEHS